MKDKPTFRFSAGVVTVALLGFASVASAQNQPPPPYGPPPGYQPPPVYQQQPPPTYQHAPAYYPPPPPPPPRTYRNGFLIGFGLGFGAVSAEGCDDTCGGAGSFELHLGAMVNPRLGLMFDWWVNGRTIPNSDGTTTNSIASFALQYWLTDILWLKGGLGFGTTRVTSDSFGLVGDATGLGVMGGIGVELFHGPYFAFDLQARLGAALHSEEEGGNMSNFALMAGFNWY